MDQVYCWRLIIDDWGSGEEGNIVDKFYIQRRNAVREGEELLIQVLEQAHELGNTPDARVRFHELMNIPDVTHDIPLGVDTRHIAPAYNYFNNKGVNITLVKIPFEDELK